MRLRIPALLRLVSAAALSAPAFSREAPAPGTTSLTNPAVVFTVPDRHHVVMKRGPVTAIVVDNHAVDVPELPGHRAGYNGLASLVHERDGRNVFVPASPASTWSTSTTAPWRSPRNASNRARRRCSSA